MPTAGNISIVCFVRDIYGSHASCSSADCPVVQIRELILDVAAVEVAADSTREMLNDGTMSGFQASAAIAALN